MTSTVTKICIDLGVEFIRSNEAYRPMATKCEAILNRVALKFGNEHLILLLRTIVESDGNQTALVEPVIWAVSDIIRGHPEWTDRGLEWLEAFDTIDLCHLLAVARATELRYRGERALPLPSLKVLRASSIGRRLIQNNRFRRHARRQSPQ